jgi:hypothetical protein
MIVTASTGGFHLADGGSAKASVPEKVYSLTA